MRMVMTTFFGVIDEGTKRDADAAFLVGLRRMNTLN